MSHPPGSGWFTERSSEGGCAFSLRVQEQLHREQSDFQTIEVYQTEGFGGLLVLDGCTMLSERDHFIYHEMLAHPALYTHPDPRRVLIVGGGDCGTLREVLRHPEVERVTQVELDARVTSVSERFFPELCEANDDRRARFVFAEACGWLEQVEPASVDLILVDSTDPEGPGAVLVGEPFYRACHRALAPGGLFAQQSESPLLHVELMGRMARQLRAAGFGPPRVSTFPLPIYPSGWWSTMMAARDGALGPFRAAVADDPPFETRYYNAGIHASAAVLPEPLRPGGCSWSARMS